MGGKLWVSIHYVEPRGFAEELDDICAGGVRDYSQVLGPSNWKNGAVIYQDREGCGRIRFGGEIKSAVLDM